MLKKPNMDPRGYELIRKWLEETGDQGFSREITPPRVNENGMSLKVCVLLNLS